MANPIDKKDKPKLDLGLLRISIYGLICGTVEEEDNFDCTVPCIYYHIISQNKFEDINIYLKDMKEMGNDHSILVDGFDFPIPVGYIDIDFEPLKDLELYIINKFIIDDNPMFFNDVAKSVVEGIVDEYERP